MKYFPNCKNCHYVLLEPEDEEECSIAGNYDKYSVNKEVLELIIEHNLSCVCEYWQKRKPHELN